MGLLDHSTNNIILDAVLTDYGRQQLATASGKENFQIVYYSLADDEVDYRLIKKYGRSVGKEKIEKNTPIFEAMTNSNIAIKYRLIGRENNAAAVQTTFFPVLKTDSIISLKKGNVSPVKVQLYYNNTTGVSNIPTSLLQTSYTIKVPDRFFSIGNAVNGSLTAPGRASASIDAGDSNRVATYTYSLRQTSDYIQFEIAPQSIDNTTLSIYGKRTGVSNERTISSYIVVVGNQHGCTLNIPVTYTATLTL